MRINESEASINKGIILLSLVAAASIVCAFFPQDVTWCFNLLRDFPTLLKVIIPILIVIVFFAPVRERVLIEIEKIKWFEYLIAFTLLAFVFRERLFFLGDGYISTRNMLLIQNHYSILLTYKNEPLAGIFFYYAFKILMLQGGVIFHAIIDAYAVVDVFSGIGSIIIFSRIIKEYTPEVKLPTIAFVSLGVTQMFFGYVENYAPAVFFLVLFLYSVLLYKKGKTTIAIVMISYTLLLFVQFGFACLAPIVLYMIVREKHYRDTLIGLTISSILAVSIMSFITRNPMEVFSIFLGSGHHFTLDLSFNHVVDYLNLFLFISPIPFIIFGSRRDNVFTGITVLLILYGFVIISENGISRDWDLYSLFTIGLNTVIIISLLEKRHILLMFIATSLLHTASWIYLNSNQELSLQYAHALPTHLWSSVAKTHLYDEFGSYYNMEQQYKLSLESWELSLTYDSTNARKWANVGNGNYAFGNLQKAKTAYEKAIRYGWDPKAIQPKLDSINTKMKERPTP